MEKMIDCSELLSPCMETHMSEASALLFSMPVNVDEWSQMMSMCQVQHRFKRSPGKRTEAATRIASGIASSSKGSSLLRGVLGKSGSGAKPKLGGVAGPLGGVAASTGKKSILRRVGKYAVVGLAAYGTYKFAKTLTKGLRQDYDDDECWRYSPIQDRYECICNAQCNIYAGSATTIGVTHGLLAVTTIILSLFNLRFQAV